MAIQKTRLRIKTKTGIDTVHLETSSNLVVRPDGSNIEHGLISAENAIRNKMNGYMGNMGDTYTKLIDVVKPGTYYIYNGPSYLSDYPTCLSKDDLNWGLMTVEVGVNYIIKHINAADGYGTKHGEAFNFSTYDPNSPNPSNDFGWVRILTEDDLIGQASNSYGVLTDINLLEWAGAQKYSGVFSLTSAVTGVPAASWYRGSLEVTEPGIAKLVITDAHTGITYSNVIMSATESQGWVAIPTSAELATKANVTEALRAFYTSDYGNTPFGPDAATWPQCVASSAAGTQSVPGDGWGTFVRLGVHRPIDFFYPWNSGGLCLQLNGGGYTTIVTAAEYTATENGSADFDLNNLRTVGFSKLAGDFHNASHRPDGAYGDYSVIVTGTYDRMAQIAVYYDTTHNRTRLAYRFCNWQGILPDTWEYAISSTDLDNVADLTGITMQGNLDIANNQLWFLLPGRYSYYLQNDGEYLSVHDHDGHALLKFGYNSVPWTVGDTQLATVADLATKVDVSKTVNNSDDQEINGMKSFSHGNVRVGSPRGIYTIYNYLGQIYRGSGASDIGQIPDPKDFADIATATPSKEYDLPLTSGVSTRYKSIYRKNQMGDIVVRASLALPNANVGAIEVCTLPSDYQPLHPTELPVTLMDGSNVAYPGTAKIENGVVSVQRPVAGYIAVFFNWIL